MQASSSGLPSALAISFSSYSGFSFTASASTADSSETFAIEITSDFTAETACEGALEILETFDLLEAASS